MLVINKMDKKKVLFLFTNNSCRSQIAEGLLNSILGTRYIAFSAGEESPDGNFKVRHALNVSEIDDELCEVIETEISKRRPEIIIIIPIDALIIIFLLSNLL